MLNIIRVLLTIFGAAFLTRWFQQIRGDKRKVEMPKPGELAIGFGTNFFDTLGIGSYAPTTSLFKLFKLVPDERIPGTMNVGHTPPTLVQASFVIAVVDVDLRMLAFWVTAAVLGAWLGAGVVARLPRRSIQIGMGIALQIAAVAFTLRVLPDIGGPQLLPAGGEALGVTGVPLLIACVFSFIFGSLMTIGVGIYAPTMVTVSLLGMTPITAFPLMMTSAAFLMPVACFRFLAARRYELRPALGLAIGGIPAVLLAVFVITSIPLTAMRILVIIVVQYTSMTMLRSAAKEAKAAPAPAVPVG